MLTKDLFVSYGRRESLGFVGRLHQQLKQAGYDAWFDKVNIPDGEDYAARINHGIETAHNFAYVMAPRCLTSPYCLIELEYARILGKRVIPLNQMVIFQTDSKELSDGDKDVLTGFYARYGVPDQHITNTQQVLDRSLALIGRTDWLDAKEKLSNTDCDELATWAQGYENHWHKHDDLDYLKTFAFPVFGENVDSLVSIVERMKSVLERHKDYTQKHTEILIETLTWQRNQQIIRFLLVGKERLQAEDWLLTEFVGGEQAPCYPTDTQCQFICESRKNSFNMMTQAFICYDGADKAMRDEIVRLLTRRAITTWQHDHDIQEGSDFARSIEHGIETADNFLYFLSPASVQSEYCQKELAHALQYNKRIIPLLIKPTSTQNLPKSIRTLQHIDLTQGIHIDPLLKILRLNRIYYEQHKILLARAIKWQQENKKTTFLLRGHNLSNALIWLRLNNDRTEHAPTTQHQALITASEAAKGQLDTEVFISYSRKDGDFARKLNLALQEAGKTTWFDQESISSGVDFGREIFKGIDGADNFIFIISPNAVESPYCEKEVKHASIQCKRFIPILWRTTDSADIPVDLRVINWIDFQTIPFAKAFSELIQTIDLDREHAHQHTVWQQRASDWVDNEYSSDFLLNVTACKNAEIWLREANTKEKQPTSTSLQQAFIHASRQAIKASEQKERRRRNIILASITGGLIFALISAGATFIQMNKAKEQAHLALIRQLSAQAVIAAKSPSPSNGSFDLALLLAAQLFQIDKTAGQDTLLRVIQNPKLVKHLYGHTDAVTSVAMSPDGQYLASASLDKIIRIWDMKKQVPLGEPLYGHTAGIYSVAFSPDGKRLASASKDKTIRLWDLEKYQPLGKPLRGHTDAILSIVFSPDGIYLASASQDGTIRLWDTENRFPIGEPLLGHLGPVSSIAFSPDGKLLASASHDRTVRLWDTKTRSLVGEPLLGHSAPVISIAFSPDGKRLVSASHDKTLRMWDIETRSPVGKPLHGHSNKLASVTFCPDGKYLVSTSWDKTIRIWDAKTHTPINEPLYGHSAMISNVVFSPDGQYLVSGSWDSTIRIWRMETRTSLGHILPKYQVFLPSQPKRPIFSVAFSPDGKYLASTNLDMTITLWDIETQTRFGEPLRGHTNTVSSIAFSPDSQYLASASHDKTLRLWDVKTQTPFGKPLHGHSEEVLDVAFSPDGKYLASASDDHFVRLWVVKTQTPLGKPLHGHSDAVTSVAFSPDGKYLASASRDQTVRLWEVETRVPLSEPLYGHTDHIATVVFSPDSKYLASAGRDQTIRFWEVKTQTPFGKPLYGHSDGIPSIAFSPDGKYLASASHDQTVRLWEVETQSSLGEPLSGPSQEVLSVAFSPDGKHLASTSFDGTLIMWDIDPQSWLNRACQVANRNLGQEEWRKYFGDIPHQKTCSQLPKDTLGALAYFKQAENLSEEGKLDVAIKAFEKARALDPRLVNFDPKHYVRKKSKEVRALDPRFITVPKKLYKVTHF